MGLLKQCKGLSMPKNHMLTGLSNSVCKLISSIGTKGAVEGFSPHIWVWPFRIDRNTYVFRCGQRTRWTRTNFLCLKHTEALKFIKGKTLQRHMVDIKTPMLIFFCVSLTSVCVGIYQDKPLFYFPALTRELRRKVLNLSHSIPGSVNLSYCTLTTSPFCMAHLVCATHMDVLQNVFLSLV